MGLEMELDYENNCTSDLSPNTVLPHRHCSNIEKRNRKEKLTHKGDILRVKEGFTEISFHRYRSFSCKKVPSRSVGLEGNIELKRGSIYQSSIEVRKMQRMGSNEGRRKVELSCGSSFSHRIVDSLCNSDEGYAQKRSPAMSANSSLKGDSVQKLCTEPSGSFIEICPNLSNREKKSPRAVMSDSKENPIFRSEQIVGPLTDGNAHLERDTVLTFHKSLSAKVEMPASPSSSESDLSVRTSSKSRFSPIRKIFDPFMKSKSLQSPLGYIAKPGDLSMVGMANMRRNQAFRKSLLNEFSHAAHKSYLDPQLVNIDHHHSSVSCSPVHLHGCLKLENRCGVPFYEFSLNSPGEVYVAKTWKANNAFNWVYTFHSICSRKKSNANACGVIDSKNESLVVGQMQVSSYLSSELKQDGDFENSMVTEFVLYDIVHARQNVSAKGPPGDVEPSNGSYPESVARTCGLSETSTEKLKYLPKRCSDNGIFDSSNPLRWTSEMLTPNLEIAAIVIELPFAKRESLKCKRGSKSNDETHSNLLNVSMVDQRRKDLPDRGSLEKLKVVIPTGNHSLPGGESQGPSSLLNRWRSGGGCDCGGWDMACPLTVFGNPDTQCDENQPLMDSQLPLQLFAEGGKDDIPSLTMQVAEAGQYAVDFHARLSTLQAFSICVAVLHGAEASSAVGGKRSKQLPHCNTLQVLIEEEVKFLVEAATKEEKKNVSKINQEMHQSYVINPPFSPIARV